MIGSTADKAHPRLRGEHSWRSSHCNCTTGSSPLTRGARRGVAHVHRKARLIPAYAGSTPSSIFLARLRRAHPRLRGEHAKHMIFDQGAAGSSPLTRGALIAIIVLVIAIGLIPAYAGSTPGVIFLVSQSRAHPRLRGEHAKHMIFDQGAAGSSPLTRGAQPCHVPRGGCARLIPAYAGSTTFPRAR